MKIVLTIAGSDSSSGAGIQADIKTFQRCGVYGVSAITAVTAQSAARVGKIFALPSGFVAAQISAVERVMKVAAVKTGMLWSEGIVRAVSRKISACRLSPLVVDPVIVAHSGRRLLSREAEKAMVRLLFPLADLVTPNIHEAERLTGVKIKGPGDVAETAKRLLEKGPGAVLITGGHMGRNATDWFFDGRRLLTFTSERVEGANLHGSGCVLSAAIAAGLAKGLPMDKAIRFGKRYVTRELKRSWKTGGGVSIALHS